MNPPAEARVAAGYDAVYAALPASATFRRVWREHALGAGYPDGFEHISFLTLGEMQSMAASLRLALGATLLDLGCGMGGPGLWIAREADARLIGVDVSGVALARARERARAHQAVGAGFVRGTFAGTGLRSESVDGAMSVDALQYAPDKKSAIGEAARVLRRGARLVFVCFEVDRERVAGVPVLGADPVDDYRPLLAAAGLEVTSYAETAGWRERVTDAYQAIIDAKDALTEEMGEPAWLALSGEIALTLQLQPYRRRVLVTATKQ